MNIRRLALFVVLLLVPAAWGQDQKPHNKKITEGLVAPNDSSSLDANFDGTSVRVVIATNQIDIGKQEALPPPISERKNNCTYSRLPCSQVIALRIWVKGSSLFVPRSAFADCTDVGNMRLSKISGGYVLALTGGDASEAYTVDIFFTGHEVKKREVYELEAGTMSERTDYMPAAVLD